MHIKEITSQHRRDFTAIYICEHCSHEQQGYGYDDTNFHQHVIPAMQCEECQRVAPPSYRGLAPKHAAETVV